MEIVFWVIVAIIVLAVVYVWALSFRKRKQAFGREPLPCLTSCPIQKGTESICRREEKPMTTLPERFVPAGFCSGPLMGGVKWNLRLRSL